MPDVKKNANFFLLSGQGAKKDWENHTFLISLDLPKYSHYHLSNSQCFLINAFTLECGRELGYNQSADHMAIILRQPQIAGRGQRLPYQSYKLSCCSSSACPLLNPFPRLPDVNYFTTFLLNPLQLQPQGNGES